MRTGIRGRSNAKEFDRYWTRRFMGGCQGKVFANSLKEPAKFRTQIWLEKRLQLLSIQLGIAQDSREKSWAYGFTRMHRDDRHSPIDMTHKVRGCL